MSTLTGIKDRMGRMFVSAFVLKYTEQCPDSWACGINPQEIYIQCGILKGKIVAFSVVQAKTGQN